MNQYVYHHAQICECGHIVCSDTEQHPEQIKNFCPCCGAKTITRCPSCNSLINGDLFEKVPNVESDSVPSDSYDSITTTHYVTSYSPKLSKSVILPSYCPDCGSPYPWVESLLSACDNIVSLSEKLNASQKETLKKCFPNLIVERPESAYSALIAQKVISCIEPFAQGALRNSLENHLIPFALAILGWSK